MKAPLLSTLTKQRHPYYLKFPISVPVYSKLERYTKLRRQVKQARLPKWPLHWMGLHIHYNGFSSTRMNYGQDF